MVDRRGRVHPEVSKMQRACARSVAVGLVLAIMIFGKAGFADTSGISEVSTPPPSPAPTPSHQSAGPEGSIAESQLGAALARHYGDQRAVYTIVDVVFLKHIAIALEEYAIDHNGRYPDTLSDISGPLYLNGVPIVPGSLTGAHYGYRKAPEDQRLGRYIITDADATVDAALVPGYQVPSGVKGTPCAPGECRHLEYSQKVGLVGLPDQPASADLSATLSCPQITDPKDVAVNAALAGQTVTVKFERNLDLDHSEHASLIALINLKNKSGKTITEYTGREVIMVNGIARSISLTSYRAEFGKYLEVGFMLDGAHASDAQLRSVQLDQILGCWTTESIKFSDGTRMSGTIRPTTD